MKRRSILAAATFLLSSAAFGDVVVKTDGTRLPGKVVQEDDTTIVLQSNYQELITRTRIARKDISEIQLEAKADASYCTIPLEGEIGTAIKAEHLSRALTQAKSLGASYAVLYIDSGGGHVDEMIKIIDLLKEQKKNLRLIAHVKRAGSAAAIIAMTCPTIILTNDGSIGAAVPYRIGPDGTPQDIEAKFFSYFESIAKSAADSGGHSTLLVRGMMEMNLTLSRVINGNRVSIVEGENSKGSVIKKPGQILTLQGKEALSAGLAVAIADDMNASLVGLKSWTSVGDSPWSYMKSRQTNQPDPNAQFLNLRKQLNANLVQATRAQETAARLSEQMKAEAQLINDQYKRTLDTPHPPSESASLAAQARDIREKQFATLKKKYEPLFAEQTKLRETAVTTINEVTVKLQQLQKNP